jgi:hypothetical protein
MRLTDAQISSLVVRYPVVLTTSLSTLQICWQTILDIYGLTHAEAVALALKDPRVLSPAAMKHMPARVMHLNHECV